MQLNPYKKAVSAMLISFTAFVFIMFITSLAESTEAAPLAWGIALNHKTKECAPYWGGDECYSCDLLSDWRSYYSNKEQGRLKGIKTDYGKCVFNLDEYGTALAISITDARKCCENLGLEFASDFHDRRNALSPILEKTYVSYDFDFDLSDFTINPETGQCNLYSGTEIQYSLTAINGENVELPFPEEYLINNVADLEIYNVDEFSEKFYGIIITEAGLCNFNRYNEEECCDELNYTYVSRLSAEDKVYNCSYDKKSYCCDSWKHSDVCKNILINHKGKMCAFVENISDCKILPENWEKLKPVEEWGDDIWYCPDDYGWLADNEFYYDPKFIDCDSNIDPIADEYPEDRETVPEVEEIILEKQEEQPIQQPVEQPKENSGADDTTNDTGNNENNNTGLLKRDKGVGVEADITEDGIMEGDAESDSENGVSNEDGDTGHEIIMDNMVKRDIRIRSYMIYTSIFLTVVFLGVLLFFVYKFSTHFYKEQEKDEDYDYLKEQIRKRKGL